MELTGYLDFWYHDLPIMERIQHFERLGIRRLDVWLSRERPMAEIYAECKRRGMIINSTFDGDCGNLVDATDHDRVLPASSESLEAAAKYEIPHLFISPTRSTCRLRGSRSGSSTGTTRPARCTRTCWTASRKS